MTQFQTFVFLVNLVFVVAAFFSNLWAATHAKDLRQRWTFSTIALLAVCYAIGYVWVLRSERIAEWSSFFRGVSPAAWLVVWCWPAWQSVHKERRDVVKIHRHAERIGNGFLERTDPGS